MAKNIRITKANQIAVNLIEAAWNDLQLYKRLAHEDPHTTIYDEMRQAKGREWNHMTDLLAAMNGMSFYEMNQSENYKKMAAIYNES